MDFLNKLRNQSDSVKKIIIWTAVVIVGILMLIFWWFFIFQKTLQNFDSEAFKKSFNTQDLEAKIHPVKSREAGIPLPAELFNWVKNFPKIEIPKISEEDFKKLAATGEK